MQHFSHVTKLANAPETSFGYECGVENPEWLRNAPLMKVSVSDSITRQNRAPQSRRCVFQLARMPLLREMEHYRRVAHSFE